MTETLREVVLQEMNEERFNRKHIDAKIKKEILANPLMIQKIEAGVQLVQEYMNQSYYASKQRRVDQLKTLDISALVLDIYVGVAYFPAKELFTSASAQIAARLKFSEKVEAIQTVAELLAVLSETDAFDLLKESKQGSIMLQSRINLSEELITFIECSEILPPMVCEPLEVTHNFSSGYLTHNDSLVLGSNNHHDGDLCLDVLNIMNKVALKLDPQFLDSVKEEPTFDLVDQLQADNWDKFRKQSLYFYNLLIQQGNRFFITNKVDKRGRIYSCGYHINPQGPSYKKAQLEFANNELIEGVPT